MNKFKKFVIILLMTLCTSLTLQNNTTSAIIEYYTKEEFQNEYNPATTFGIGSLEKDKGGNRVLATSRFNLITLWKLFLI